MSELEKSSYLREINDIEITGFVNKQRNNVFEITVEWPHGIQQKLSRRYCDFASFHRSLLIQYQEIEDIELPEFPSFQTLFHTAMDDSCYLVPDLDILTDYCKFLLANLNNDFVKSFFDHSHFDLDLKRKRFSKYSTQSETVIKRDYDSSSPEVLEYLVIADFKNGMLSIEAGEVVTVIGMDCEGWNMISHVKNKEVKYGWIPENYLILKEESDEIVEDIQIYLLAVRELSDVESTEKKLRKLYNESEVSNLLNQGCCFYKYYVVQDAHLYHITGNTIEANRGDVMTVVDKDSDGWWFVSCKHGDGWIASTVLEPRRASLKNQKTDIDIVYLPEQYSVDYIYPLDYTVTKSYIANQSDELCLADGEIVKVLMDSNSGWWTVRCPDKMHDLVGLFPAVYLTRTKRNSKQSQVIGQAYSIGQNSSLAKQPPPRRGVSEICLIDLFPPPFSMDSFEDNIVSDTVAVIGGGVNDDLSLPVPHRRSFLERRVSMSAPNSPDFKLRDHLDIENDAFSDNEDAVLTNPSKVFKKFPQRFLTPTSTERSPSIDSPPRKASPIPLRFYKKTSSSSPRPQSKLSLDSSQKGSEIASSREFLFPSNPGPTSKKESPVLRKPYSLDSGKVMQHREKMNKFDIFQSEKEEEMEEIVKGEGRNDDKNSQGGRRRYLKEIKKPVRLGNVKFADDVVIKESIDLEEVKEKRRAGLKRMSTGGGGLKKQVSVKTDQEPFELSDSESDTEMLATDENKTNDEDSDNIESNIESQVLVEEPSQVKIEVIEPADDTQDNIKEESNFETEVLTNEKDEGSDEEEVKSKKENVRLLRRSQTVPDEENLPYTNDDQLTNPYATLCTPPSPQLPSTVVDCGNKTSKQSAWNEDDKSRDAPPMEVFAHHSLTIQQSSDTSFDSSKSVDVTEQQVSLVDFIEYAPPKREEIIPEDGHTHLTDYTERHRSPSPQNYPQSYYSSLPQYKKRDSFQAENFSSLQSYTRSRHRSLSPTSHAPPTSRIRHHSISPTASLSFTFPVVEQPGITPINHSISLTGDPISGDGSHQPVSLSGGFLQSHQRSVNKLLHEKMHKQ